MALSLLTLMQFLHDLGTAWGVGGATIVAILMMKGEKDPKLAPYLMKVFPTLSKLIWIAVILLIISGIALQPLISWPLDANLLAIKHALVVLLVVNALNMTFRIFPKMEKFAPKSAEKPSEDFLKIKSKAKVSGAISLSLWYLILIFSVIM